MGLYGYRTIVFSSRKASAIYNNMCSIDMEEINDQFFVTDIEF